MNLRKNWILALVAGCVLWIGSVEAQPDNGRSSQPGSPNREMGPSGSGRSAGPAGSPYSSQSPYSGPGGPSFSSGPRMGGPSGAASSRRPVQSTRFSNMPQTQRGDIGYPGTGSTRGQGPTGSPYSSTGRSPADTSRMQQALRQRDYQAIGQESQGIRNRTKDIQSLSPGLPVQDRLKLPLINQMYRQGADIVDDGRTKRDESKIRYGIQQINEANEKLGRLENQGERKER